MTRSDESLLEALLASIGMHGQAPAPDEAVIEIHHNRILRTHLVPGFEVDARATADGVEATLRVTRGTKLAKPVRVCFGMLPEDGLQHVVLHIALEEGAEARVNAWCTFPNARAVRHLMDADIALAPGAVYAYFERHVHGPQGGVTLIPRARVAIGERARFRTEFELIRGGVGRMEIDYDAVCAAHGVFEMLARISGRNDDQIRIREAGRLAGDYARGLLTSHVAVRDRARAEIHNVLIAEAAYARGHVDCKEIVQGAATAHAAPVVEVRHPQAHVTHEAAIGSVDSKQLQTLMSRGLSEDEAVDLIIQGMLA